MIAIDTLIFNGKLIRLKTRLPIPTNRDVISQCLNAEGRFVIWEDAGPMYQATLRPPR